MHNHINVDTIGGDIIIKTKLAHVAVAGTTYSIGDGLCSFTVKFTDLHNPTSYIFSNENMDELLFHNLDFNAEYVIEYEIEKEDAQIKNLMLKNMYKKIEVR